MTTPRRARGDRPLRPFLFDVWLLAFLLPAGSKTGSPPHGHRSAMIDRSEINRRLVRLAESPNIRFWRVAYDQLSLPERVFGLIWEFESEVNNGGFLQY